MGVRERNEPSLVMVGEVTVTELGGVKGVRRRVKGGSGGAGQGPVILQEGTAAPSILEGL